MTDVPPVGCVLRDKAPLVTCAILRCALRRGRDEDERRSFESLSKRKRGRQGLIYGGQGERVGPYVARGELKTALRERNKQSLVILAELF